MSDRDETPGRSTPTPGRPWRRPRVDELSGSQTLGGGPLPVADVMGTMGGTGGSG